MRKITSLILIIVLFISCNKKNKINHYLNKVVTQKELLDNGFYKYSFVYIPNEEDKIDVYFKSVTKFEMYSNVKPEKNEGGQLCPIQLWHFYIEDSIKEKKNRDYLKNKLNNRIITYFFRNDTLLYKDIIVDPIDESQKDIADFTSRDKIIKYYNGVKTSIKSQIKNKKTGEMYSNRFLINNYNTRFYMDNHSYEMFVDYKEDNFHDVLDRLYGGTYCN
ncbi:hypothetical protein [Flavobacterium sp. 245]|uniref:hypothetical protein n=1 Tax=Flavobacterium sp. 245 TaxID=2512115 RepID=UPI00105FE407|nr:hypothetical protein [Flavobacterium sp. 245]